jgi:hypothetical protein
MHNVKTYNMIRGHDRDRTCCRRPGPDTCMESPRVLRREEFVSHNVQQAHCATRVSDDPSHPTMFVVFIGDHLPYSDRETNPYALHKRTFIPFADMSGSTAAPGAGHQHNGKCGSHREYRFVARGPLGTYLSEWIFLILARSPLAQEDQILVHELQPSSFKLDKVLPRSSIPCSSAVVPPGGREFSRDFV